jgi:hypothetical protein
VVLSTSAWEAIFLLAVLKIPMIYLAVVVWWAIRAEPTPGDGQEPVRVLAPLTPCGWDDWRRRRPTRPTGLRPNTPHSRPVRRRRVAQPA